MVQTILRNVKVIWIGVYRNVSSKMLNLSCVCMHVLYVCMICMTVSMDFNTSTCVPRFHRYIQQKMVQMVWSKASLWSHAPTHSCEAETRSYDSATINA